MIQKNLLLLLLLGTTLYAQTLEKKIGQMLMIGFHGTTAKENSQICKDIKKYNVGAVILFDYNPVNKSKPKNIATKSKAVN